MHYFSDRGIVEILVWLGSIRRRRRRSILS